MQFAKKGNYLKGIHQRLRRCPSARDFLTSRALKMFSRICNYLCLIQVFQSLYICKPIYSYKNMKLPDMSSFLIDASVLTGGSALLSSLLKLMSSTSRCVNFDAKLSQAVIGHQAHQFEKYAPKH